MSTQPAIEFTKIRAALRDHFWLWMLPTIALGVLSTFYAVLKPNKYKAAQALLVRDEAIGALNFGGGQFGRFDSNDQLKRALETILEIAKKRSTVEAALKELQAPSRVLALGRWPSDGVIEAVRREISIDAPKGTEFGQSEVVYLSVTAGTRDKAIELNKAVCEQLEFGMQQLRDQKARSVISDFQQKLKLAEDELLKATTKLARLEKQLGPDLGEMRTLAETGSSGDSNLRTTLNQIKEELRRAEADYAAQEQLLKLLVETREDPQRILAAPNRLLEAQPALRRLKEGLVDAQLRTAALHGTFSEEHPQVKAARQNEVNVQQSLQRELENAILAVEAEMNVTDVLADSLRQKQADLDARLTKLAAERATYANLAGDVSNRREQVRESQKALADAQALAQAARSTSLISRLDEPDAGNGPIGPGRLTIMLGGTFGGFLAGLGLVYLLTPLGDRVGRRRADRQGTTLGRRESDRRASDASPSLAESFPGAPRPIIEVNDGAEFVDDGNEYTVVDLTSVELDLASLNR